jgi:hypothetical protein
MIAAVAVSAAAAVGCGGSSTDVSQGVANLNKDVLRPLNAKLDCPKTVNGGAGAKFDCTLRNTRTGKSAKLKMTVAKQDGKLAVDVANQNEFKQALKQIGAA